jgi:hypothetical protein
MPTVATAGATHRTTATVQHLLLPLASGPSTPVHAYARNILHDATESSRHALHHSLSRATQDASRVLHHDSVLPGDVFWRIGGCAAGEAEHQRLTHALMSSHPRDAFLHWLDLGKA